LQTYDAFRHALFVFAVIELASRRVIHYAVTRSPTDAWVVQQLCNATLFGEGPRFLIRDNDRKSRSSPIPLLISPSVCPLVGFRSISQLQTAPLSHGCGFRPTRVSKRPTETLLIAVRIETARKVSEMR
jgi:hypothetical protein